MTKESSPGPEQLTIPGLLRAAVSSHGDKPFLVGPPGLTYAEMLDLTQRAATRLLELGVVRGDRVALMLPNGLEFLAMWFAAAQLGAAIVPINTAFRAQEASYILSHCEPRVFATTPELLHQIGGIGSVRGATTATLCCDEAGDVPLAAVRARSVASAPALNPSVHPDDIAAVIYTSGTTGLPKGVMQTHRTYALTGLSFPRWLGLGDADRLLTPLPLSHINAQAYSVMGAIGARASLVLLERFSASRFWQAVRLSGATQFNVLGAIATILLRQEPALDEREHSARLCYLAPALPPSHHREFEQRFGVRVVAGYAMTECTFGTIGAPDGSSPPGSMGRPRSYPGSSFRSATIIVDETGTECAPGEVGEIVMCGPTVMRGYFRDADGTSAAIRDGKLYSGDLAYRDEAGNFYFAARKKDLIRRRGENVSPAEIEEVLRHHPAVEDAAVVPVPSELTDEDIVAFVVLRHDTIVSESLLQEWCGTHLARFKVPERLVACDALPLLASGKVAKQELRARAADLIPRSNQSPTVDGVRRGSRARVG